MNIITKRSWEKFKSLEENYFYSKLNAIKNIKNS